MRHCYIHIPFCESICAYCDFCKMFYNEALVDKYLNALEEEVNSLYKNEILDTIYIGGGTPSALNLRQLERLFSITDKLRKSFNVEFTMEANFSSIDQEKLEVCKKYGVNRLSFGLETTSKEQLMFLERKEDAFKVKEVISLAKNIGFNNINVDLMYALPGETIDMLRNDIQFILDLDICHISCYSLIIEEHTKLGIIGTKNIDPDLDYLMYEEICKMMRNSGFDHYEISNFSRDGYNSRHNLAYWENKEYYGFGLGASSYIGNERITNTRSINRYLEGSYVSSKEVLEKQDKATYEIMLGLRKKDGLFLDDLFSKYGIRLSYQELVDLGLMKFRDGHLYIPEEKWYISNEIIIRLLEDVVYE